MNQQELIALLQSAAAPNPGRTKFCVDDQDIAAYVDGSLDENDHQRLERHLAECPVCVGRVGLLSRLLRDSDELEQAPEPLLARARRLIQRRSMHSAPKWAAAAVITLAVVIVPNWDLDTGNGTEEDARTTRTVPSVISTPQLIAPSSLMSIPADELNFTWHAVADSLYYKVRIVSDTGSLIMERRVTGTDWQASDELSLSPGTEYFFRVDAYMSDAKTISSEHVRFKIRELN